MAWSLGSVAGHGRQCYIGSIVDSPASYFEWGFVLISIPNVIFLVTMVVLFVLALLLPFPHASDVREPRDRGRG